MDTAAALLRRISDLDQPRDNLMAWAPARDYVSRHGREPGDFATAACPVADLAHVVHVIGLVAGIMQADDDESHQLITAAQADDLMRSCLILRRLTEATPEITESPLRLKSQYWVATGRPEYLPDRNRTLDRQSFQEVAEADLPAHAVKPFNAGLFTSTSALGTYGMWRIYLDMNESSTLFPQPWYTWWTRVRDGVAVKEISDAVDWVGFVDKYAVTDGKFLYPDWKRVACDYDGVHVRLGAVATIEGIPFPARNGVTAPAFWGVESTFWLRWCFTEQSLCQISG